MNEHTVYERRGSRWIFKENHYGEVEEFPGLEDGEIILPHDDKGIYYVSNFGRVWNRKNRKWVTNQEHKGRFSVSLYNHPQILSRVVAQVFIPNLDNKPEVNHKDENPANNKADNLEWMTREENLNYGTRIQRAIDTKKKKKMRKQILDSKQKAIQKIKSLILQYNISFEDIYPPADI